MSPKGRHEANFKKWTNITIFYFVAKKKKNLVFLLYIYNFYIENLIYKWIKQFENQLESGLIF